MNKFDKKYDKLVGGMAEGMNLLMIANKHNTPIEAIKKQFDMGEIVEKEHSTDVNIAREITLDHLFEDPEYYTKLAKMEKK